MEAFLAGIAESSRGSSLHAAFAADPELPGHLERAFCRGASAWPGVELSREGFARHLGRHVPEPASGDPFAALRLEDLYLAAACLEGLPAALDAFERAHMDAVRLALAHLRLTPQQLDEVRQSVRQRLFVPGGAAMPGGGNDRSARIGSYAGRSSLSLWLRALAVRVALNQLAAERGHHSRLDGDEQLLERLGETSARHGRRDPELAFIKRQAGEAVAAAFKSALAALAVQERNLLRLHYVEGISLTEIGAMAGVHKATISRRLAHLEARLAASMRRRLGTELGLPASEVEDLIDLVWSQLELSLSRLLGG